MSEKSTVVWVVTGLGLAALGAFLFWPKDAHAAPSPQPGPQPQPQPQPAPQPSPQPAPAPVPIPPKLNTGPGSQVEYGLIVTGDGVNVRTGPGTQYPVIQTVSRSTKGLTLPHSNAWSDPTPGAPQGWSGVVLPSGQQGWIASQYLQIPN